MKSKQIYIGAITLVIAGLVISTSAASVFSTGNDNIAPQKNIASVHKLSNQAQTVEHTLSMDMQPTEKTIIGQDLYDFYEPCLSDNGNGYLLQGAVFENRSDPGKEVLWAGSDDDGDNWPVSGIYWSNSTGADCPSSDHRSGTEFIGTHATANGETFLMEVDTPAPDYAGWTGGSWDWTSYGWYDQRVMDAAGTRVAGYDDWLWFLAFIASTTYTGGACENAPHMQWPTDDQGYSTISWFPDVGGPLLDQGSLGMGAEIDALTGQCYGVWDFQNQTTGQHNLIVYKSPINDHDSDEAWIWSYNETIHHIYRPHVAANNDNIVIVMEFYNESWPGVYDTADIVCWYNHVGDIGSDFGGSSVAGTAGPEADPKVEHVEGTTFVCTWEMNNSVYRSVSTDAGETWGDAELMSDVQVVKDEHVSGRSVVMEIANAGSKLVYQVINQTTTEFESWWRHMEYVPPHMCGDPNGDTLWNILDITYLINYLYRGGPQPVDWNLDPLPCTGDINGDTLVNILDITYMINYLYRGGPPPEPYCCSPSGDNRP
jgi:hypothetical protein